MSAAVEPGVSVVIPVYHGERTIERLVDELAGCLRAVAACFEILLVEDGSADRSWTAVERLARRHPFVRGIRLLRNYGQHNALLCGVRAARFDTIVTMDDDRQHPPREIPKLLERLQQDDCDVVYGVPEALQHSALRNLLSRATKRLLASALGSPHVSLQSPFRAFRTSLRDAFTHFAGPDIILDVLLSWGTRRFAAVPVRYEPRREGASNYDVRRLVNMALLLATAYTTAPLRIATWIGFSLTLFGLAVLGHVLYVYFFVGSIPGFPFLASLISIFSGAQLFTLGVFGEYLARIFNRTLERPSYVVKTTANEHA